MNNLDSCRDRAFEDLRGSRVAFGCGLLLSAFAGVPMPLSPIALVGPVVATLSVGAVGSRAAAAVGFVFYLALAHPSAAVAIFAGIFAILLGWVVPTLLGQGLAYSPETSSASALVLDTDGFRNFDEAYGSGTGEHAFRLFRRAVEAEATGTDLVVQMDGNELVLLTDGSSPSVTRSFMARVGRRFSRSLKDAGYECDLSIGLIEDLEATRLASSCRTLHGLSRHTPSLY